MITRKWIIVTIAFFLSLPVYATPAHHCSAKAAPGTVALTFDDGPSPIYTKKVLEILEKYHIHATFFVVGEQAKAHPQSLKMIVARGNVVGNHSLTHPQVSHLEKTEDLYREVVESGKIIADITGKKPGLFRFPYGADNPRVKQYVISQGLTPVRWSYSSEDYASPGTQVIADRVIQHARSGQIILLHDGPAHRKQTIDALPKIIEGIKKKGLDFSVLCC
jgi:peptidoglycan-N-acetylglucosamine deacetylase